MCSKDSLVLKHRCLEVHLLKYLILVEVNILMFTQLHQTAVVTVILQKISFKEPLNEHIKHVPLLYSKLNYLTVSVTVTNQN